MEQLEVDDFILKMGKRIRELRKEYGMTQLDLAIKSNVDERQIQRLERGHTSATLKTLLKISAGLNVEIVELFNFSKE